MHNDLNSGVLVSLMNLEKVIFFCQGSQEVGMLMKEVPTDQAVSAEIFTSTEIF